MKLYHGTPCGSLSRNAEVLREHNLCLTWTTYAARSKGRITGTPTASAYAHAELAQSLLLDCGAFPIWRAQERYRDRGCTGSKPPRMDVRAVIAWYRALIASAPGRVEVLIPDAITGGERANDLMLRAFPVDLVPLAWPVWHTEESLERFARLAQTYGRVAIGAMGRHRNVTGAAYTARMVEVFNLRADRFPDLPIHMLRGLKLAGGPFPFASGDSTDAGRNHSQTPQRLRFVCNRWAARARCTTKTWHRTAAVERVYSEVRQVTFDDHLLARTT